MIKEMIVSFPCSSRSRRHPQLGFLDFFWQTGLMGTTGEDKPFTNQRRLPTRITCTTLTWAFTSYENEIPAEGLLLWRGRAPEGVCTSFFNLFLGYQRFWCLRVIRDDPQGIKKTPKYTGNTHFAKIENAKKITPRLQRKNFKETAKRSYCEGQ